MFKQIASNPHALKHLRRLLQSRFYHSENGVWGYKSKPISEYQLPENAIKARQNQSAFFRWVEAYRAHGHRLAQINPVEIGNTVRQAPELEVTRYGLDESQTQNFAGILNTSDREGTVKSAREFLDNVYCGSVSAEFAYTESEHEREWLAENYEASFRESCTNDAKREIAALLLQSQAWDNFLATKYPSVKRYSGEGAESMLAFFRQLFISATDHEVAEIVLGMPHRGRLNLLTTMLNTRPAKIFRKYKGHSEFPSDAQAMGDTAMHFHASEDLIINGKKLHVTMPHNPSHLEVVNPVSMGKTRSKQQTARDGAFSDDNLKRFATSILNVQLHGDAAFAGQGINQEMLMMTGTPNFEVGGTIHLIVNNQLGFTTPGDRGRCTRYSSDLAKCISAPVFHVNGDDPEALSRITKLAFEYQREFRKDVFIDLNCFRRWGHNELDDPTFTNPSLYKIIHARKSVPDKYVDRLSADGVFTEAEAKLVVEKHVNYLNSELAMADQYQPVPYYYQKNWKSIRQAAPAITVWDTGVDYSLLHFIGKQSVHIPEGFNIHPHLLKTHVNGRLKRLAEGMKIDWATAEALAIGSLMSQGHNVRISGEDVGRGTFSQRHAMLIDQENNEMYIPLNTLKLGDTGKLEVANSILSEEAVLGFEYGMAIDNPNNLIIWEAQFGDFFNGAQIVIDTFVVTGETKWMIANGLVMLLPHGYDGAASEHSSCRVERFLQQTDSKEASPDGDDVNMQVINPTTPAQYFHALRRQIVRDVRKPLVVVGPKLLLRLSDATSAYTEFLPGTHFQPVLADTVADAANVTTVLLCSGKHYYNLNAHRIQNKRTDVAIVRVESLCPFPVQEIIHELDKYKKAQVFVWSQEEHRNMGAWSFIKPRFDNMCGRHLVYCGRGEGATTAVGISSLHKREAEDVVIAPFNIK